MYQCTICGEILEPHQCKFSADEERCEIYVSCPRCGGECENYNEDEEGYEEDGKEAC